MSQLLLHPQNWNVLVQDNPRAIVKFIVSSTIHQFQPRNMILVANITPSATSKLNAVEEYKKIVMMTFLLFHLIIKFFTPPWCSRHLFVVLRVLLRYSERNCALKREKREITQSLNSNKVTVKKSHLRRTSSLSRAMWVRGGDSFKSYAFTRLETLDFEFKLELRFPNSIELNRTMTFAFVQFHLELELTKKFCIRFRSMSENKIEFYRSINFDWVRLSSMKISFDVIRRAKPHLVNPQYVVYTTSNVISVQCRVPRLYVLSFTPMYWWTKQLSNRETPGKRAQNKLSVTQGKLFHLEGRSRKARLSDFPDTLYSQEETDSKRVLWF